MNIEKFSQDFEALVRPNKNPLFKKQNIFNRVDLGYSPEVRKDNYVKFYNLYKDLGIYLNIIEPDEENLKALNNGRILNFVFEEGEGVWYLLSHSLSSYTVDDLLKDPFLIFNKDIIESYATK